MKISLEWLQGYFDAPLSARDALADALTFHVAEIEEMTDAYLDVKVLPDRACYLLSHRGVAYELSAILGLPMKKDPLRAPLPDFPKTPTLSITGDPAYVVRHTGALIEGVKVGPSPTWLQDALAAVGQRSINNVVDIMNYVMLDMGQPSGAFDAGKLGREDGVVRIAIRRAVAGEKIKVLTGETHELTDEMFVFTDAVTGNLLDIAGIKGGFDSGITDSTTSLFITAGNYDGTLIRRAAQKLKLFTDASLRFQNRPSPALTAYGMRDILALITEIAGGEVVGVVDDYPEPVTPIAVSVPLTRLNGRLGSTFSSEEVEGVFTSLGFAFTEAEGTYSVLPPFERRDVVIPEDVAEEVGRVLGYDRIPATVLPGVPSLPEQTKARGVERVKDFLVERGFVELSTQSFDATGDIELANPLQQERPWLRSTLLPNMRDALIRAGNVAPRVLGPNTPVKLFELGTVFTNDGEFVLVALGIDGAGSEDALKENVATLKQELLQTPGGERFSLDATAVEIRLTDEDLIRLGGDYEVPRVELKAYEPFSLYPFALRDIAVWTPVGISSGDVERIIRDAASDLLVRIDLFDTFEKDGRVSYAFRLVFESPEKTLSDTELTPIMEIVTNTLNQNPGFSVR